MTDSVRLALALVPLAAYFFAVGSWQGGRRPKLVAGPVDSGLLSFGLGNLIAFGPVGQVVVRNVFPSPGVWAWLTMASLVTLATLVLAPRAAHRLVIYHVSADDLRRAVGEALADLGAVVTPTVDGFEDHQAGRGVRIEVGRRLRFGVVEGYGNRGGALIAPLAPRLIVRLREIRSQPSWRGTFWVVLAGLTLVPPLSSFLMGETALGTAFRAWIHRLRGG